MNFPAELLLVASVVFVICMVCVVIGWKLCKAATPDQQKMISNLLQMNRALQNKLVASSLQSFLEIQKSEKPIAVGKNNSKPERNGLPPDQWGRDIDFDEDALQLEENL